MKKIGREPLRNAKKFFHDFASTSKDISNGLSLIRSDGWFSISKSGCIYRLMVQYNLRLQQ